LDKQNKELRNKNTARLSQTFLL